MKNEERCNKFKKDLERTDRIDSVKNFLLEQKFDHQTFGSDEMAFYREAFTLFDKDGNGSIDYEELKEIFISLNEESSESELQLMINNIDFNKTGKVDFDEFIAVMETTKKNRKQQQNNSISQFHFQKLSGDENSIDTQSNEALVEAFRAMDADGNGMISPADLRSVLKGLSQDASAEKVLDMIRDVDMEGNGQVSFESFVAMMKS